MTTRVLRRLAVIDVAQRAGMSLEEIRLLVEHGTEPISGQLRELAARKLPEIDALIERAQRVRAWLETATGCDCQSIDDCALFDDAPPTDHRPVQAAAQPHHRRVRDRRSILLRRAAIAEIGGAYRCGRRQGGPRLLWAAAGAVALVGYGASPRSSPTPLRPRARRLRRCVHLRLAALG